MNLFRIILAGFIAVSISACKSSEDSAPAATPEAKTDYSIELSSVMKYYYAGDSLTTETVYVPQGFDFGELLKNKKVTKTIKISNSPIYENYATDIRIEELEPKIFKIDSNTCSILKSGSTCLVTISASYSDELFTSIKTARLVFGKASSDSQIDIATELFAQVRNNSINSGQFESNYDIEMNSSFDQDYHQFVLQERIITVANKSLTKYLRNDYIVPSIVGVNTADFFIRSNQCMYPVPPLGTCKIHVIFKKWKTASIVPDTEIRFPNKELFSLKFGQPTFYTPVYSEWGMCSTAAVCAGRGVQNRTINQCIKNGFSVANNSQCATVLSQPCVSPAGSREYAVEGGSIHQTCMADSTTWINESITCSAADYHANALTCLKDVFVTTSYSDYDPSTNPHVAECSGKTPASRSILGCKREHNNESVDTSKCSDPLASIIYKSPAGVRTVSVPNGSQSQSCAAGETNWITTNTVCVSSDYYVENNACKLIEYVATFSDYSSSPVTSQVCSGDDQVSRTITACRMKHSPSTTVDLTKCIDPVPVKTVYSPSGYQTVILTDTQTNNQMGTQNQFCATGGKVWTPVNTSCYTYYTSTGNNSCVAANLAPPLTPSASDIYSNAATYSFSAFTSDVNSQEMRFYFDNTCTTQKSSGMAVGQAFSTTMTFPANVLTPIYAQGVNNTTLKKSSCTYLFSYMNDTNPPSFNLALNGTETTKPTVTLHFTNVQDNSGLVNEMLIYENATCSASPVQIPYMNDYEYTPSAPGRQLSLSVKLRDAAGNNSSCVAKSIFFGLKVKPLYANGANWNSYVNISNTAQDNDTKPACSPSDSQTSGNLSCIHAGERRKVSIDETSCAGLTLTDDLNMFEWTCRLNTSGKVEFLSVPRKDTDALVGINKMINTDGSTPTFKPVKVSLYSNGIFLNSSEEVPWYTDTLAYANISPTLLTTLSTAGTIYVVKKPTPASSTPEVVLSGGVYLNGNRIGLVVMPLTTLRLNVATNNCGADGTLTTLSNLCLVFGGGHQFNYIEGQFSGNSFLGSRGIFLSNNNYNLVKNSSLTGFDYGVYLLNSLYNTVNTGSVKNSAYSGVHLNASNYNQISNFASSSNALSGYALTVGSNNNVLANVKAHNNSQNGLTISSSNANSVSKFNTSSNGSNGIYILSSSGSKLNQIVSANNAGTGISVQSSDLGRYSDFTLGNNTSYGMLLNASNRNILKNIMSVNNNFSGLRVESSNNNTIAQLALLSTLNTSGANGSLTSVSSSNNKYTGNIYFDIPEETGNHCVSAGTTAGTPLVGFNSSCASQGLSDASFFPIIGSESVHIQAFVSNQPSDLSAYVDTPFYSLNPWTQTYGLTNSSFSINTLGKCASGNNCSVMDWTVGQYDFLIRGLSNELLSTNSVTEITTSGQNCPVEANGSKYLDNGACLIGASFNPNQKTAQTCTNAGGSWRSIIDQNVSASLFLKNAKEVSDYNDTDFLATGSHDGLCESSESCVYAPNFGAYQGESKTNACLYNPDGYVTGVIMKGYSVNGK